MVTSWVFIPTKEKTSVEFSGIVIVNSPFALVSTPILLSLFNVTLAEGNVIPVTSVTQPDTVT